MKAARLLLPSVIVFAVLPLAARAQTELRLSASGTARVSPDELVATLQAQNTSGNAAAAQSEVNRLMAAGLAAAHKLSAVDATTENYSVQNDTDPKTKISSYQASQTLRLVVQAPDGKPDAGFSNLLGRLQQSGFLLQSLDGELSGAARAKANLGAIADAMDNLHRQAEAVASSLHEPVGQYKIVTVNMNAPGPIGRPMPMMFAAKMATPPQAAPSKIEIDANLTATIELGKAK